jgi:hypothetical protein
VDVYDAELARKEKTDADVPTGTVDFVIMKHRNK